MDETIFSPTLDSEDVRLPESYHIEEFCPGIEESCIKLEDARSGRLSELYTDDEFSAETEEVCAKTSDTKDERLFESDTDEDFSAENVELVSHGHSHSEMWSTTLDVAVNLKETQIVSSGLN